MLFELGDDTAFHVPPAFPDLAFGTSVEGITYLHGRLAETDAVHHPYVLSSSDFGRAYLSEAWATNFIRSLLDRYTVVLVGYQAEDPPIKYLLQGLNHDGQYDRSRLFAFDRGKPEEIEAKWRDRGVTAIAYVDHPQLWQTIEAWADRASDHRTWRSAVIQSMQHDPKQLTAHQRGQVVHVLRSVPGAKLFAEADPPVHPEWICVLDASIRSADEVRGYGDDAEVFDPKINYGLDDDRSDLTDEDYRKGITNDHLLRWRHGDEHGFFWDSPLFRPTVPCERYLALVGFCIAWLACCENRGCHAEWCANERVAECATVLGCLGHLVVHAVSGAGRRIRVAWLLLALDAAGHDPGHGGPDYRAPLGRLAYPGIFPRWHTAYRVVDDAVHRRCHIRRCHHGCRLQQNKRQLAVCDPHPLAIEYRVLARGPAVGKLSQPCVGLSASVGSPRCHVLARQRPDGSRSFIARYGGSKDMRMFLIGIGLLIAVALVGLFGWRMLDHRADRAEMNRLIALQPSSPARFTLEMVAELPEPARRYFAFTISEGTHLFTVAQIEMTGQFSLGTQDAPNYMDMTATQVLAAPEGFVWKMSGGTGLMQMSGSDSGRWTRFWLAGLAPVARFGGDPDHARSAFGRYTAEAAFWTPAALLPGAGATWEPINENTARVTVRHSDLEQAIDVTVDARGRPIEIEFQRWSNANPDKVHRLQPFGGHLSDFRDVDGYRLPFRVEAGNMFGTDAYFPFFLADLTEITFPKNAP